MAQHVNKQNYKLSDFVKDGKTTEACWNYITTLSKVVIAKYFSKYLDYFDKEGLVSLAVSDAASFMLKVASQTTDDDIRNIRNVVFTRIRNTLSNFIFRSNRLVNTDDEILDKQIVMPKSFDLKSDLIDMNDLCINSINNFRDVSLKVWQFFKSNGTTKRYFINDDNNSLDDWKAYSEAYNMKTPCDLISIYDSYTEDQIEQLANKLDAATGQNYFNTLYQLLGDKFLAFLDVFQEDKFNIPSTMLVKHLLTDIAICADYNNGMSEDDISIKYNKTLPSVQKIIKSKNII